MAQPPSNELRERREHGYEGTRPEVQALVPRSAVDILELGCSSGRLGAELKHRQTARVVGVEIDPATAKDAETRIDRVICASVEEFLKSSDSEQSYDCLIAADVLEHLVDPWSAISDAVRLLRPGAAVVVSLPNVLYLPQFARLVIRRRWPREDEGIFDRTHLRWFTQADAIDLLASAGLEKIELLPSYWTEGWRRGLLKLLGKTPLAPFLAGQHLVRGYVRIDR